VRVRLVDSDTGGEDEDKISLYALIGLKNKVEMSDHGHDSEFGLDLGRDHAHQPRKKTATIENEQFEWSLLIPVSAFWVEFFFGAGEGCHRLSGEGAVIAFEWKRDGDVPGATERLREAETWKSNNLEENPEKEKDHHVWLIEL